MEMTQGAAFESFGLSELTLRAIKNKNYQISTPVQAGCIPPMMAGKDVIAKAPTGTGKTCAFGIRKGRPGRPFSCPLFAEESRPVGKERTGIPSERRPGRALGNSPSMGYAVIFATEDEFSGAGMASQEYGAGLGPGNIYEEALWRKWTTWKRRCR